MKKQNDKGFTLIEMMVSAAILGVGVIGMAAMQGISFTKNVDANDLSIMTNVASDMMERIQNNRKYAWAYNNLQTVGAGNCGAGGIPAPFPVTIPRFGGTNFNDNPKLAIRQAIIRAIQGDCVQWGTLVNATNMVNVQGTVQVTPVLPTSDKSSAMNVAVQLTWNERGASQRPRTITFRTQIEPE
ncbi:MAG: prepilin-type N-terminal cleavage/methylation domain-containing protein [Nitrospira sp.]|nr:prepilin-type N-terminal cleavage/methylation domain-containing protein [Nitrospira sp.]MBH0181956.1 prepilin-type N-terminal cleavage/methylation domain-containing protein [Nitrospira sp.]MBH0184124.1 prepilin-type N-terminal cleavage/methylation domain-containing protein [Nitrospira sp.]MBH0195999.1 prepilin-type N-terminal cleavage/methylation domain-containing protein [Nitrospira sp.]